MITQAREERILREDKSTVDVLIVTQLRQNCDQIESGLKEIRLKDQNLQVGIEIEKQRLLRGFQKVGIKEKSTSMHKSKNSRVPKVQVSSKPIYNNQTNDRFISVNKNTYLQTKWIQKIKQLQKLIQIYQHNQTIFKQQISALNSQIEYLKTIITQKQTIVIQLRQKSYQTYQTQINSIKEQHKLQIINVMNQYGQKIRRIEERTLFEFNTLKQQHRVQIINIINQYNQKLRRADTRQSFEIRIKELQILIKEKQSLIIKLQNQIKTNLENNRKTGDKQLKEKVYKLQSEINRINQVVQRKQREKNVELQRAHQITIKYQQQRQKIQFKEQQINKLNIIIKQFQKEFETKQIQIENYKKSIKKYQTQKDTLFKKYQFEKQQILEINSNLSANMEILKKRIYEFERQSGNLGNKADQRIDDNDKKIVQLAKINLGLQEEVKRLRLEIISLKATQRKLFQRQQEFQRIQSEYNLTIKNLKQNLTIIQTEYYNYKKDVEININQNHNCQYKQKLYESELTIKKLLEEKQNIQKREIDYKSLLLRYQVLEKQNQKLIIKMKIASDSEQKHLTRQKSQITRLNNIIAQLQIKLTNYNQNINQKNIMSIRILQLQRSIQNYQIQIQKLRKIDYNLQNHQIKLVEEYKKKEYQLNCQIQNRKQNILLLQKQVNRLSQIQKKLIEAQKKVLDIQRQSSILIQAQLAQVQNQNISLHQKILQQKKQLERLYPIQIRLAEAQKYLKQNTNQIVNQLQYRIQQGDLIINKLRIQNHQFRQSINNLQIYELKCKQLERQIIQMEQKQQKKSQVQQKNKVILNLKNQINVLKEQVLDLSRQSYNYSDLKNKYEESQKKILNFISQISFYKSEIIRLSIFQTKLIQTQNYLRSIEASNARIIQSQKNFAFLQSEVKRFKLQIQRLKLFQIQTKDLSSEIQNIKRIHKSQIQSLKSQIQRLSQFQIKVNQLNLEIISIRSQSSSNIDLRIIQAEKARKIIESQTNKLKLQVQRLMKVQWQSEGIRNNLNNAQKKIQQLQMRIKTLEKQIQRLKSFQSKLFEAQSYIFSLENKSNLLQPKLQRAEKYIIQLQLQIARIKIQIQKLPSLQLTITQLKKQVQLLTSQLKKQIPSNSNQNQLIKKYQLTIFNLKNEIFILSQNQLKIKDLNHQVLRLNNEIFKLKNQLSINTQSRFQTQKLKQIYQMELVRLKSQISRLSIFQARVQQSNLQITNLQLQTKRLAQFQHKIKELILQIQSLKSQKLFKTQQINNNYQNQIIKLNKQILLLKSKITTQFQQQIQLLKTEIGRLKIFEEKLFEAQTYIFQLEGKSNQVLSNLQRAETYIIQLQAQIVRLKNLNTDKKIPDQSSSLKLQISRLNNIILVQQTQIGRFKSIEKQLKQAYNQIFKLKSQHQAYIQQKNIYQSNISNLKNEINRLSILELKISQLNNQILTIRSQSSSQFSLKIIQSQKQKKLLQQQIKKLKLDIEKSIKYQSENQKVKLDLLEAKKKIASLESEIIILQKQNNRLKILEVRLVGLQGDLKVANQKYNLLISNNQSSTNLQLLSLRSQLQSVKKCIQAFLNSFNIQNISFSSFNTQRLPTYIHNLYKLINEIKSKFQQRESLVISLQTQCFQLKKIISQNSQSSNDSFFKIKIEQLESKIFQLRNSNEAYLRINNSLSAKLQASQIQRQFLFNQYQKLRTQLQKLQNISLKVLSNTQSYDSLDVQVVRNRLNAIESVSGESLLLMKNHYTNLQKQIINQLNDLRKIVNLIDSQQNRSENSNKPNHKLLNKLILDVSQLKSQYKKFHSTLWILLGATTNQIKQLGKTISQNINEEFKNNKDQGQKKSKQLILTFEQLDAMKRKYHASQLAIQTMERQKQKFSDGLLRLKVEMQSMKKQIQSANSEYLVAKNQCQGWRQQTINLRNKIQRYQQQSRQIITKQSQINQYIQALQIAKKVHKQEKQNIENQLKNIAIALQSAQNYIRDVDNQKIYLIQELQKLQQINHQIYSQRSILQLKLNQFNQNLGNNPKINQDLATVQLKVQKLQHQIHQAEIQRDSLRNRLHQTIQDNQKLQGQNYKIKGYISQLQRKEQENRSEISLKLTEANSYIINLQHQIKNLQVRDHQISETSTQIQNLKNKLATIQNYMFTIQSQKIKLIKQLEQVIFIKKSFQQQKKILNKKLVQLNLKDINNQNSLGSLEVLVLFQQRLKDYQKLILQAQKDRDQLKTKLNQTLQKNRILKENYNTKTNQLDNKLTASQSDLHQKLLKTQQYVNQLQSQKIQLTSQKTALQSQIKSLLILKQNIQSSKAQLIRNYNNLLKQKQKQQNINIVNQININNQQIINKSILLQKQIAKLKQTLKQKESQIKNLNFKLMQAQSQVIIQKNKLTQLDHLKNKLTESQLYVLSIKKQKQQLQQAYENLIGERNYQNLYIGQLKNQREQIIKANNQLIKKTNIFEEQSLKLQQINQGKQEKQQFMANNKRLIQQNEVFKSKNINLTKKLQQLDDLKNQWSQLTNQNNYFRETLPKLQLINRDILKQNQNIKLSYQTSIIQTKQLSQKIKKLEQNKKYLQQENSKLLEDNQDLHRRLQLLALNLQQSLQKPVEIPIKFEQALIALTLSINSEQNIQTWDNLIKTYSIEDLPVLSTLYENLGKRMKNSLVQKNQNSSIINYQKEQINHLKKQLQKSINDNQKFIKKINDYDLKLSEAELLQQRYQQVVNQLVESDKSKQLDAILIRNLQKQLLLHKSQVEQYTQKIIQQSNQENNILYNQNQQLNQKLNNAIQQLQQLKNNNQFNEQTKQLNQFLYNCLLKIQVLQKNANSIQQQLKNTQKTLKIFDLSGKSKEQQDRELLQSQKEQQTALKYIKEIIDSDKNYISEKAKLQHYLQLLQKNINKSKQASDSKYDINYQFGTKDDIHKQLKQLSEHVTIYHRQTNRRRQLCLNMVQLLLQGTDDILSVYSQIANDLPQIRIKQPQMQGKMKQLIEILNTLSKELYPDDSPFQNFNQYNRNNQGDVKILSSNYLQILKVVERKDKEPNDQEFSNALNFLKQSLNENNSFQYNEQLFGSQFRIQKSNNIINQIEQRKLKFYKNPTQISEEIYAFIIRIVSSGNDYAFLDAIEGLFEAIYTIQQRFQYMIKRKDEEYLEHTNKMNQIFNRRQSDSYSQQFNPLTGQKYPGRTQKLKK